MYPTLLGTKENAELVNGVNSALKKFFNLLGELGNIISHNYGTEHSIY